MAGTDNIDVTITVESVNVTVVPDEGPEVQLVAQEHVTVDLNLGDGVDGQPGAPGSNGQVIGYRQYLTDNSFAGVDIPANTRTLLDLSPTVQGVNELPSIFDSHDFLTTGQFDPFSPDIGDKYRIRLTFNIVSDLIDNEVLIELDIGGGQGVVDDDEFTMQKDAGTIERKTATLDFYSYGTFLTNLGSVYITPTVDCTVNSFSALIVVEKLGEAA